MFVLVVTRQAAIGELVRQALAAEGWWVTAVADRETAVRSASEQAPQLVVVDGEVDEAAELVRFFASANGGPGALLLAPEFGAPGAAGELEADEVLTHEPSAERLAAAARRLLEQEPPPPSDGLPTPGQVLNAQDIFGEMLSEMETEGGAAGPPPPAAVAAAPRSASSVAPQPVETRSMFIPEPSVELAGPELDFSFAGGVEHELREAPALVAPPAPAEPEDAAPEEAREPAIPEPQIVKEEAAQPRPEVGSRPAESEAPAIGEEATPEPAPVAEMATMSEPEPAGFESARSVATSFEAEPILEVIGEVDPESDSEPGPLAAEALPPSVGSRLAAMAKRFKRRATPAAGEAAETGLAETEVEPQPPVDDSEPAVQTESVAVPDPLPQTTARNDPAAESEPVTEPELVAEPQPTVEPEPAVEREAAVEPQRVEEPEPAEIAARSEPEPAVELEPTAGPETASIQSVEEAALSAVATARPMVAAAPARPRVSLPGGKRFWLGMAAGLLVFVAASFFLGRFFRAAPEAPPAVTAPAVDAADLQELVDQEMAQREAELRESLLEEERRLQEQLDQLTEDDG